MAKTTQQAIDDHAPWKPAKYDKPVALAFQSLASGTANSDQQILALTWLIEECCKTYDMSYRPNHDRDTVFAEGKRFVGNEVIRMTKVKTGNL